jgi:hypothetical protein
VMVAGAGHDNVFSNATWEVIAGWVLAVQP